MKMRKVVTTMLASLVFSGSVFGISANSVDAAVNSTSDVTIETKEVDILGEELQNIESDLLESEKIAASSIDTNMLLASGLDASQTAAGSNFVTFEGGFEAAGEQDVYMVDVDFTTMNTASFCLVRTGREGVVLNIYDESDNKVGTVGVSEKQGKNWLNINKPSAGVCTYKIVATPSNTYSGKSSDYRIMVGQDTDAELMMSGKENAVPMEMYYESKLNFQSMPYTPNKYECWFKYSKGSYEVITIMLKNTNVRFKIYEVGYEDGEPLYDSADDVLAHRTSFVGSWACAEKVENLTKTKLGKQYYLVVYNTNPSSSSQIVKNTFIASVGKPMMGSAVTTVYPDGSRSLTINKSTFKPVSCNLTYDSIPKSGQVKSIILNGVAMSKLTNWRAKVNGGSHKTNKSYSNTLDYAFKYDSNYNTKLKGLWVFEFKAYSSTVTITPSFTISYYYEYGDTIL